MHACRHAYMYVCICMCFLVCLVVRACIFEILFSKMLIVLNILGIRYSSPSPAGPPPSRLTRAYCKVHLYSPSHCRNYTHLALADHLLIEDDLGRWLFFIFLIFSYFCHPGKSLNTHNDIDIYFEEMPPYCRAITLSGNYELHDFATPALLR